MARAIGSCKIEILGVPVLVVLNAHCGNDLTFILAPTAPTSLRLRRSIKYFIWLWPLERINFGGKSQWGGSLNKMADCSTRNKYLSLISSLAHLPFCLCRPPVTSADIKMEFPEPLDTTEQVSDISPLSRGSLVPWCCRPRYRAIRRFPCLLHCHLLFSGIRCVSALLFYRLLSPRDLYPQRSSSPQGLWPPSKTGSWPRNTTGLLASHMYRKKVLYLSVI